MKNLIFILFLSGALYSCSKYDKYDLGKYPQKWQLIEMYGQEANAIGITGDKMQWQEFYILNSNGTFAKHREVDGILYEGSGTFSVIDQSGYKSFKLVYDTISGIIGSCYGKTEILWIKSEIKLWGTWSSCDGPGLVYDRVE